MTYTPTAYLPVRSAVLRNPLPRGAVLQRGTLALLVAAGAWLAAPTAQAADRKAEPNVFVEAVASEALDAVLADDGARAGNLAAINRLVDSHVLPYVNLERTTRLAAGQHWRQATPSQQKQLVDAFKNTLIRTYSGALSKVDPQSRFTILPFRGDPKANDVVVRSTLSQSNGPAVAIDYRLERQPDGWKIYDLNVEGIWLIQNYRNQFHQEITRNGIDGLIAALGR